MQFTDFANYLSNLELISSRNELSEKFAVLISKAEDSNELKKIVYLTIGRVAAKYEPIEFNFAEKQLLKVLRKFFPRIDESYKKTGDLGSAVLGSNLESLQQDVFAENEFENSISFVFFKLYEFATTSGQESVLEKSRIFQSLVVNLDSLSLCWVIRIILGKMRIGFSDKSIIDSFSIFLLGDKSMSEVLEHSVGVRADIAEVGKLVFDAKLKNLNFVDLKTHFENLTIELFTPIAAKLVERVKNPEEIIVRMGGCFIQPKFDGLRIQAHVGNSRVELFSRNMENTTNAYPDLVEALLNFSKLNNIKSVIFDGEVVGYNFEENKYLSFQETVQRKRKNGIEDKTAQIPVVYNIFDLLYLENQDISKLEIQNRIEKLDSLNWKTKKIKLAQTSLVKDICEIQELFDNYVLNNGLEGVIAKKLSTIYEPGTRNFDWVKLKRSTNSTLNDFADLVVLGYYIGKGKRTDFGIGGILCGTHDKFSDKFLTVCKVGTGFSDEQFKSYKVDLDELKIKDETFQENIQIDQKLLEDLVLVEPKIVVEIEADEITTSELHSAGFSLRFPRIKQWNRDKSFNQTTTKEELRRMFEIRKR